MIALCSDFATLSVVAASTKGFPSRSPPGQKPSSTKELSPLYSLLKTSLLMQLKIFPIEQYKIFSRYHIRFNASSDGVGCFLLKKGVMPSCCIYSLIVL